MACLYPLLNPQKHIRSYNHPEEYGMERAMRHRQIIYNVFFFFVFLYLLFVNYNSIQYLLNPDKIDISQLYKFQAVLSQDVEFIDPVEGGSSLYLYIEGEKDLKFNIPYSNDNWYIEEEIFKGDSIVLTIQKEDYKKWISKKQKLDFDDKYLGYGIISVYGIQKGEISFWDPESFQLKNEESEEQNFLAIQILNILTILGFVFWYLRKKKKYKKKKKEKSLQTSLFPHLQRTS